ncbi:Cytochrome c oxidase subunit 6, mitochondrial [Cyphellophora attinorum]|uniref:Cytochrome c oxidase subunit 6, mitochondrial n=1 Tax=Cyphellophora attinorum TaxID=1664694 RepID=A0A0N0NR64_9EURO|nr:Cytochrome c oxidase subunit 6, mitochondrial [Phialophora attinorum]KPI44469.1 Cytochrome c oxidase subunit 6, mitochondrial [Phialophora attinorum]
MAFHAVIRLAARQSSASALRSAARPVSRASSLATTKTIAQKSAFSSCAVRRSGSGHEEETFEEFSARYEKEFDGVNDVFELQRNLNNAFAYDLVPSPGVVTAALKAARRVNDFPTAVRIFEGIKAKVENTHQYQEYLDELKPLREELGINLKEDLYPGDTDSPYANQ